MPRDGDALTRPFGPARLHRTCWLPLALALFVSPSSTDTPNSKPNLICFIPQLERLSNQVLMPPARSRREGLRAVPPSLSRTTNRRSRRAITKAICQSDSCRLGTLSEDVPAYSPSVRTRQNAARPCLASPRMGDGCRCMEGCNGVSLSSSLSYLCFAFLPSLFTPLDFLSTPLPPLPEPVRISR